MISCGLDRSSLTSHPTGCVVESFNLIYYLENHPEELDDVIKYFSWVPYDLSTHQDSSCNFDNVSLPNLIMRLNRTLQLKPQFTLYNIPMLYYVE